MFKVELAKRGDILLYKPGGSIIGKLIAFLSYGGKYAHAALYLGNENIVESHIDSGVVSKPLNPKWHRVIDVYRIKPELADEQIELFVNKTLSKVGCGYDLAAFPSTFFKSVIARIFGFKNFARSKPVLNNHSKYYCSELISVSLSQALGIQLVSWVHASSTTPSDLAFTPLTYKVKE